MRAHTCHVGILGDASAHTRSGDSTDKVVVVTAIPVEFEIDAVVEESHVGADIKLVLLLVGQFAVLHVVDTQSRLAHVG